MVEFKRQTRQSESKQEILSDVIKALREDDGCLDEFRKESYKRILKVAGVEISNPE